MRFADGLSTMTAAFNVGVSGLWTIRAETCAQLSGSLLLKRTGCGNV
ncbi:MAG: hypothetical protein JO323_10255 [Acidobacteriia bacterium]|nr:hypothetical protein [Terriglobia bacterium]